MIVQLEQGQVVIPTGSKIKGSRTFYWILLKETNLYNTVFKLTTVVRSDALSNDAEYSPPELGYTFSARSILSSRILELMFFTKIYFFYSLFYNC